MRSSQLRPPTHSRRASRSTSHRASHRVLCMVTVLMVLLLGAGCAQDAGLVTIATDLPEVVEYLEFVRDSVSPPHFELIFDTNPDRSTVLGDISPDIIISSRIAHEQFEDFLFKIPLSRLNKQDGSNTDSFILEDIYPASYEPYLKENSISIFPIAFDLPIVYLGDSLASNDALAPRTAPAPSASPPAPAANGSDSATGANGDSSPHGTARLSYEVLLDIAEEYTVQRRDVYSVMGFSSVRNILFIDLLIREHTNRRGSIPQPEELEGAMDTIIEYLNGKTQNPPAQVYYNEIFAYSSNHANLSEGHLHANLSSFYTHNIQHNSLIRGFPYVWLYSDESIEALNPVYIGIVQNSRNKREGIELLRKLLSATIQTRYLKRRFDKEMPSTAFLFRMSSNRIVNEYMIGQLSNNRIPTSIPAPESITFPGKPIFLWDEIQTQVYYPWLLENLVSPEISTADLYESLDSYYKLNRGYR